MRKILLIFFVLMPLVADAGEKVKIGGVYYELWHNAAGVTFEGKDPFSSKKNYKGHVVIPSSVTYKGKEYSVTEICSYAFIACRELVSVVIPNSVSRINDSAFTNCTSLSSVKIGENVHYIGRDAFGGTKLTSVEIPNSVRNIWVDAFAYCNSIGTFKLGTGIKVIEEDFIPQNVKTVIIPDGVTVSDEIYRKHNFVGIDGKRYVQKRPAQQDSPTTPKMEKADPKALPILDMVQGSMAFVDAKGIDAIEANGKYSIRFQLKNTGKGPARGCIVKLTGKGQTQGVSLKPLRLPDIAAAQTMDVNVPITTDMTVTDGEVEFAIQVDEPNGFGTDPQYITVKTRAFEAPLVQVTDYSLTADGGTTLKKKQPFDLQLMLQNTKHGQADDVQVSVEIPQNVLMVDGKEQETFAALKGGETKSLVYSLIVNNNYQGTTIPIKVHVKERLGKYAKDRTINLQLDQAMASTKISVDARPQEPKGDVAIARLGSDVDKDLPQATAQQQKTFAVIIANEHYRTVEAVPFAANDGKMFEAYCRQTLGIPQQNIHTVTDATLNDMKYQVDWLRQVMEAYNGEARAVVYYAGHGIPNEQDQTAYLLPTDGYVGNASSAYSLSEFYQTLGALPARSVMVFLDACFSGTRRDGKMLASARGVAIKAKAGVPQGSMVVFSAAQGDETAYPYQEQQHGMFTYYLLKKLKETEGSVTLGSLSDYVAQEVKRQSIVQNSKMQTPTVTPSAGMGQTWRSMTLK